MSTRPASPPPPPPPPPIPSSPKSPRSSISRSVSADPDIPLPSPRSQRLRSSSPCNSDTSDEPKAQFQRESIPNKNSKPSIIQRAHSQQGSPTRKSFKKTTPKSFLRRSFSSAGTSNHQHENYISNPIGSLFRVSWPPDDRVVSEKLEFERYNPEWKADIWYMAKELKYLMHSEIERNKAYEEGEMELNDDELEDDVVCWRGLEHVYDEEDRSTRIKQTVREVVGWYKDSKEMGYSDPDELRTIAKSWTKTDRTRAKKRGQMDAAYVKKMTKQKNSTSSSSGNQPPSPGSSKRSKSPKKMVKRWSAKITSLPSLNWSPRPSKKMAAVPGV